MIPGQSWERETHRKSPSCRLQASDQCPTAGQGISGTALWASGESHTTVTGHWPEGLQWARGQITGTRTDHGQEPGPDRGAEFPLPPCAPGNLLGSWQPSLEHTAVYQRKTTSNHFLGHGKDVSTCTQHLPVKAPIKLHHFKVQITAFINKGELLLMQAFLVFFEGQRKSYSFSSGLPHSLTGAGKISFHLRKPTGTFFMQAHWESLGTCSERFHRSWRSPWVPRRVLGEQAPGCSQGVCNLAQLTPATSREGSRGFSPEQLELNSGAE